jgi:dTDP-D-glucose 4,6-dehydratase
VYGEVHDEQEDLKEHSPLVPTNPYAATKAAAEHMVTSYAKSFKLPAVVIRLNNIYGPHQVSSSNIDKRKQSLTGSSTQKVCHSNVEGMRP